MDFYKGSFEVSVEDTFRMIPSTSNLPAKVTLLSCEDVTRTARGLGSEAGVRSLADRKAIVISAAIRSDTMQAVGNIDRAGKDHAVFTESYSACLSSGDSGVCGERRRMRRRRRRLQEDRGARGKEEQESFEQRGRRLDGAEDAWAAAAAEMDMSYTVNPLETPKGKPVLLISEPPVKLFAG
jgi:hypothetical protein